MHARPSLAYAAAICASALIGFSGCQQKFAQIQPIARQGLELHLTDLTAGQRLVLGEGTGNASIALTGFVRAEDGGVGFTTERRIRFRQVTDEKGRDLLAVAKRVPDEQGSRQMPFMPFTGEGYAWDSKRGYACSIATKVDYLPRLPQRLSVLSGEVRAIKVTERQKYTLTIPESDADRFVLRELSPGLWFSLDEMSVSGNTARAAYRCWYCNDVAPQFAGRPMIGRTRDINLHFISGDEELRVPGYAGYDPARPPWLQQVRIIGESGREIMNCDRGGVGMDSSSGVYTEFKDEQAVLAKGDRPVRAEVTVITKVEAVSLPFELKDVPLSGVALAPPPTNENKRAPGGGATTVSDASAVMTLRPEERKSNLTPISAEGCDVLLYNLDFDPPVHAAGSPPVLGDGPAPRHTITQNSNGRTSLPEITAQGPGMSSQALRLSAPREFLAETVMLALSGRPGMIGGREHGFAEPFVAYRIAFDLVITEQGQTGGGCFALFADAPGARAIRWNRDGTITGPPPESAPLGRWDRGEMQHVEADWDLRTRTVKLRVNGQSRGIAAFDAWEVASMRLSVGNAAAGAPGNAESPAEAFVDNLKLWGLRPCATASHE